MNIPNRAGLSIYALTDEEYEDSTITEVKEFDDYYDLRFESMGIGMAKSYDGHPPHGIVPKIGDQYRSYGEFGQPARGMAINGILVYWHSPDEQRDIHKEWVAQANQDRRDKFEKERPSLDAQYEALPDIFKKRIDRFRQNNPDFRWEYESYELFCCTEAMKFVNHFKTFEAFERYAALTQCSITDEKERWYREWEEQKAIDRAAGIADGHSGNTHGMAVALAGYYLRQPEAVAKLHGALSPLVGSWAYGDMPPDGGSPERETE